MTNHIPMDTMLTLLKGLQREKACLQEKLKETRAKKELLQSRVRGMSIKYRQITETNVKLRDTLNIAQTMLDKSHQEQRETQEAVKQKRQLVDNLKTDIQSENDGQLKRKADFQERLSELADRFIAARKFYQEDNLRREVDASRRDSQRLCEDKANISTETDTLAKTLQALQLDQDQLPKNLDISEETQIFLFDLLTRKNESDEQTVTRLREKIGQLRDEGMSI